MSDRLAAGARIAFVTPWYGDIPGGAEAEARRTAQQLARRGATVEVWTTCIRDFHAAWDRNHHPAGAYEEHGVTVRRFPVVPRDRAAFDAVNARLMRGQMVSADEETVYLEQQFHAPGLYDHIAAHAHGWVLIFIPYLFPSTVFGVRIAPRRSLVIPCLHDEMYARLPAVRQALGDAATLLLHSYAERDLADRLLGASTQPRPVIGEGVDTAFTADADRFRRKYGIDGPFLLYVGRKDPGKNTPLLLRYWRDYVRRRPTDMQLILVGPGNPPPPTPQMRDLGFVPAQDKYDAYAAATIFCNPSVNESFSLVLMESWLAETPAIVHGACDVTVEHCRRAQAGLYFQHAAEFGAVIDYLLAHPTTAARLGRNGRRYVLDSFAWPHIIDQILTHVARVAAADTEITDHALDQTHR